MERKGKWERQEEEKKQSHALYIQMICCTENVGVKPCRSVHNYGVSDTCIRDDEWSLWSRPKFYFKSTQKCATKPILLKHLPAKFNFILKSLHTFFQYIVRRFITSEKQSLNDKNNKAVRAVEFSISQPSQTQQLLCTAVCHS